MHGANESCSLTFRNEQFKRYNKNFIFRSASAQFDPNKSDIDTILLWVESGFHNCFSFVRWNFPKFPIRFRLVRLTQDIKMEVIPTRIHLAYLNRGKLCIIYHTKVLCNCQDPFLKPQHQNGPYIKTPVDRLAFLYSRYLNNDDFHITILIQTVLGHKQREGHYEQIITRHAIKSLSIDTAACFCEFSSFFQMPL